jgi:hypothetical protein
MGSESGPLPRRHCGKGQRRSRALPIDPFFGPDYRFAFAPFHHPAARPIRPRRPADDARQTTCLINSFWAKLSDTPRRGGVYAPPGIYVVTAKLPERDGEFEYHIRHASELHERIAKESQLHEARR